MLPRWLCPGDSPRGTPRALPGWGPRAGWLPAKHPCGPKDRSSRAASLTRGKCVTSSRPGQGSSNRTAPLVHPVCREPGVRQLYPGGSHAAGAGVGQHTGLGQEQARPQRREAVPPPTPAPTSEREAQAQPICPVAGRKGEGAELCSAVPASTGGTNSIIKQDRTFHLKKLFCFVFSVATVARCCPRGCGAPSWGALPAPVVLGNRAKPQPLSPGAVPCAGGEGLGEHGARDVAHTEPGSCLCRCRPARPGAAEGADAWHTMPCCVAPCEGTGHNVELHGDRLGTVGVCGEVGRGQGCPLEEHPVCQDAGDTLKPPQLPLPRALPPIQRGTAGICQGPACTLPACPVPAPCSQGLALSCQRPSTGDKGQQPRGQVGNGT